MYFEIRKRKQATVISKSQEKMKQISKPLGKLYLFSESLNIKDFGNNEPEELFSGQFLEVFYNTPFI